MMRTIPSLTLSLTLSHTHSSTAAGGAHIQRKKRIKGYLKVTRAMGDFFLKDIEFNGPPLPAFIRSKPPYFPPYIHCSPDVREYELTIDDRFLLLASDGLWEACTDEEVTAVLNSALLSVNQKHFRRVHPHTLRGLET
jgi:serine/threonine protein phosphatase PrpC